MFKEKSFWIFFGKMFMAIIVISMVVHFTGILIITMARFAVFAANLAFIIAWIRYKMKKKGGQ